MNRTIKILTLLAVMAITAGQAWAEEPTYGIIHYTQGGTDGGRLSFSTTLDMTYNAQTDFNGSQVSSGNNDWIQTYTVTGKTLADGKVYVRAVPNFGYTVTDMTLIVEPSAPSSTAEAPRRGAPGVASTIPVTPVEGHSGVYTFPMPTDGTNVTVTASFPVSPLIDVDYLDATGAKKTAQAYVLDGAELYLGMSDQEFWYVCNSAINYRTQLRLYGDTHIILADDATMTISAGTQHAIYAYNGVTIHGQSGASGKLIAEATSGEGIYSKGDITIISADVSVTSTSSYAVHVNPGNITITDSKVTVNGGLDGFVATNVSGNTTKGNITINGSQVTAIGGTHANDYGINAVGGDITLGWTNASDFIKASSYHVEDGNAVKTADGKPVIAYTPAATANDSEKQAVLIQGNTTLTANAVAAIAGKVLRPATADDVTVKYLDAKGDEQNTAEDNITDNDIVYVLQGNPNGGETLAGGWYVAEGEVSYTGQLQFTGNAHLILADDAEMSFGTANNPINVTAINTDDYTLSIYGQSTGDDMGTLSIYTTQGVISASALTINGGHVIGNTNGDYVAAIFTGNANITINGGTIESTTSGTSAHAIEANGTFTYTGGTVTAIGTIYAKGDIILGWTNATDFINASSYTIDGTGSVKTADGKRFIAYNMASADDISANCIIGSATGETTLNDTDLDNIAGKTLRPLEGYYVKDQAGLTFSGKTAPDFTINNFNKYNIPCYIYKAADEVTLTTDKNYGQNGIWFTTSPDNAIADAIVEPGTVVTTKTFAMPAQDFSITYVDYYNTGVKYMDWDDTQKKLVEKTTPDGTKVMILTGTTGPNTTLGGNWYVVNDWITTPDADGHSIDVAYNHNLCFTSTNVNLILADGCEMTVTDNSSGIYAGGNVTINGQSAGTGSLTATGGSSNGIYAGGNVTINGGNITATGSHGIRAWADNTTVTINGGKVTATGGTDGYGIYASSSMGNATIILNLTNASDFIKANSYNAKVFDNQIASVRIPAGKALAYTDGTTTVLGNTDADYIFGAAGNATLASIAGQTLRMSKNMPVSAVSAQYAALYQEDGDWKVTDPAVKMYVPTGNIIKNGNAYEMELKEVTGGGIPNGVPVILGKEGGLGDIPVVGTSAAEANTIEANYNNTESEIEQKHKEDHTEPALTLFATNTTETLAQQIINAASPKDDQGNVIEETKVDPSDYVVLGIVNGKLTSLSANQTAVPSSTQPVVVISKFDLLQMIRGTYAATNSNAPSIVIDLGDVTGISDIKHESLNIKSDDAWYTMDGRKLNVAPTQKGIYIFNGTKRVVK